jgi:methionyl-tRNA formyltransferase
MSDKLRVAFIGCVEFSHSLLERVLQHPRADVVGVVTRAESPLNSDFRSLAPTARARGIPVFEASKNQQNDVGARLSEWKPDVTFCFGWPYLLHNEVLSLSPKGTIGYHPTRLPRNRGRHPIIWTLALGLTETASTFFFMDTGADSGDILEQRILAVRSDDDSAALYGRLCETAVVQVDAMIDSLLAGDYRRIPQDHSRANYWRKRDKSDGLIDWRMDASSIYNLVRALARPYPGAHCIHRGLEVKIWSCRPEADAPIDAEPGKVLAVDGGSVLVQCGSGSVRLMEHGFGEPPAVGDYIR